MRPRERVLQSLLSEVEFRVLELLAGSSGLVTGRSLAREAGVSPTTASAALAKLLEAGFVVREQGGRAFLWQLNRRDPTITAWLHGSDSTEPGGGTSHPRLKVLLLTALPIEYSAVADHLQFDESTYVWDVRFERATFEGELVTWDVYAAEIGMGNIRAAIDTTAAIERFSPDLALFVGVAGSIKPNDACRGDVVVPDRVYELGAGKEIHSEDGGSELLLRPFSSEAARAIAQFARSVARGDWMGEQMRVRPDLETQNADGASPRVTIKSLVAGNRVLADDESALVQSLRKDFNDVVAVDMESLGFYQASQPRKLAALSVRGISDHVGDKAPETDQEWQPIAAAHAASFAFSLLRKAGLEDVYGETRPPVGEPPGGGRSPRPGGPTQPGDGALSEREMLYRLPPAVAVAYSWAGRVDDAGGGPVVKELHDHRDEAGRWLDFLENAPTELAQMAPTAPTLFMVAEFAESHEHQSAPRLLELAATHARDPDIRGLLLGRASWSARRRGLIDYSDQLLAAARGAQPRATSLWNFYGLAFHNEAPDVVDHVRPLACALGLQFPDLDRSTVVADRTLEDLGAGWQERCPELLDLLRFQLAIVLADGLRRIEDYSGALRIFESMNRGVAPTSSGVVWASLVGPRGSTVPLELARTICMRVASGAPDPGVVTDFELVRAVELALTARERRRDWNGPTTDPLAIAAEAKARSGDPRGALRMLLPPPRGTALPGESAAEQIVELAPRIAYMTGDSELTMELARRLTDPVERRITTALVLSRRQDSYPEAAREFRAVLAEPSVATRIDQRVRALLGLAMVAELTAGDEQYLADLDGETRDLIRAQSMISGGNLTDAQVLMRPHHGSSAELQIAVEVLMGQGRTHDAITKLEEYATRNGEERLFLHAASLAMSAGLLDRAEQLAARVSASQDALRRQASLEMLVDIAQQRGDWQRVISETNRLLSAPVDQVEDPESVAARRRYRWARVNALYQERDALASRLELDAEPPLEATSRGEALLILAVFRAIAHQIPGDTDGRTIESQKLTQRDVLNRVSVIAKRFPDDEEILAGALTTSLSMPAEDDIDPEALLQARELQDLFFDRFPESKLVQRITVPDSPEELAAMVGGQLSAAAGPLEQVRKATFVGQVPLSGYAAAAQRSYAQALAQNAAGAYVIESVNLETTNEEIDAARSSLNSDIVVDTSALFHADRVLGDVRHLHDHFARLILPSPLRDDILSARASLARRSAGSFGWDPVEQRPSVSTYDEATTDKWAAEAQRLAETIELCDVLPDPPFDGDVRNRLWSSAVRLAKERHLSLVADDLALRHVARTEGVQAFGTLHLLAALIESGALPASAMNDSVGRLQGVAVADLPLLEQIQEIAAREAWNPSGYAGFLLTRPFTWTPPSKGLGAYMTLVREIPDRQIETIAEWCAVASYGMALAVPPPLVLVSIGSLVAWTILDWKGPEALPLLLNRTRRIVAEFAPDGNLLRDVVERLMSTLRQIVPAELVSQVALQLLNGLDEDERRKAIEYLLAAPD